MDNLPKKIMPGKIPTFGVDLTPGQRKFVDEYLVDLNAKAAVLRAFPDIDPKKAGGRAAALMKNGHVSDAISIGLDKRAARREIKAEMVMEELACIAFQDIRNVVSFNEAGVTFKNSDEIDDQTARAISEVSETVTQHGGTKRVKMCDKVSALELLGRHFGMFKDKVEHSGGMVILDGSRMREPNG